MLLKVYPRIGTRSRRAIVRIKTRFGRSYQYSPRGSLITRLAKELGMSREAVYTQIMQEREYLLKQEK